MPALLARCLLALRRHQLSRPMDAANYRSRTTEGTIGARPRPGGSGGERAADRAMGAAGAELGRGDAVMAPERLGELGGLAVSHAVRDLADRQAAGRQQLAGALHADSRELVAERRVPDLGERPLQLAARRGDAAGDVIERELFLVLVRHDLGRVFIKAAA